MRRTSIATRIEPPTGKNDDSLFDLDDDDGWQEMPIVREHDPKLRLDEEDQKKYHYVAPSASRGGRGGLPNAGGQESTSNATGNLIDFDDMGYEWREKAAANEEEYTRLKLDDDEDADEAYLRTKYLFDEDKAMTPLSQMQATKNLLTEAQRIAYVGLCYLVARQMSHLLAQPKRKELNQAVKGLELWRMKIMGRIYYHMELEHDEQKMIDSLAEHGVDPMDLVPSLMATHTVANPEYDPAAAQESSTQDQSDSLSTTVSHEELQAEGLSEAQISSTTSPPPPDTPTSPSNPPVTPKPGGTSLLKAGEHGIRDQTTANILQPDVATTVPGVSTTLSASDSTVTLDIRWTVLCDLFLILIADSVYDSRSRVLLETVAAKLGLAWLDVVRFEKRVTDALEIQEAAEQLEQKEVIEGRSKAAQKRRYVMMGLATIGGGLVIGLSAGLLAPVIGVGLGAALSTVGITGTSAFLTGTAGAAVITTGGVLTGSGIAVKGMARRTQQVRIFELLPLHNNKRVSCIITVSGFMASPQEDVRLPFSVLDSIVGDVFSIRWEPEMMGEMGNALKILTSEVISQVGTTVLQATVMTALMSALQWPIILTKLGYLIDNPWSNALDRARAAGLVLADVLMKRALGVRPITLIGFSLGARQIFYTLIELAKHGALGIVQDVILLGATVTAPQKTWLEARSVVSGRFVNGYARNDWILNYLFRATTGGGTVAGLRPIDGIPGLENVDVTDKISGHMSYRTYMPVILDQLGFPVTATFFDEPEEPDMVGDREVVTPEMAATRAAQKKNTFSIFKSQRRAAADASAAAKAYSKANPSRNKQAPTPTLTSRKTSASPSIREEYDEDADLPERIGGSPSGHSRASSSSEVPADPSDAALSKIPAKAGFDFTAIGKLIGKEDFDPSSLPMPAPAPRQPQAVPRIALDRSESVPPPVASEMSNFKNDEVSTPRPRSTALPETETSSRLPEVQTPTETTVSDLRANFQRSLSMNDASTLREENEASSSSAVPSTQHVNSLSTPSWPPPSSMLSYASSEGSAWSASGSSLTYQSPTNGDVPFGASGPLRRQAPPAHSFESYNAFNPSLPIPLSSIPPNPFASSYNTAAPSSTSTSTTFEPQLSFGSVDGGVTPSSLDAQEERDKYTWAPKPIGLGAAIANANDGLGSTGKSKNKGVSSYTLNPWDN